MKPIPSLSTRKTIQFNYAIAAGLLCVAVGVLTPTVTWAQDELGPAARSFDIKNTPNRPTAIRGIWTLDMITVKSPYGNQRTTDGAAHNFRAMQADGIHGIAGDIFLHPELMQTPLSAADGLTNFKVSPMIDLSVLFHQHDNPSDMVSRAVDTIESYCKEAEGHKSAAITKTGRYVVWMYGINQLSPDQWQQMKDKISQDGFKVYYIGQVKPDSNVDLWDEYYNFFPTAAVSGKIATIMPAYTRERQKTVLEPDGGTRLRQQWQQAKSVGASAVFVVTWNGFRDGSDIAGHSDLESATKDQGSQFGADADALATDNSAGG